MFAYLLGHCPELGVEEFKMLSNGAEYELHEDILLSTFDLDPNLTGSIIWQSKLLGIASNLNEILNHENLEVSKKIGFLLPGENKEDMTRHLRAAKDKGFKKINIQYKDELNFGDYKATKTWYMIRHINDQNALLKLTKHVNQEFWAVLDEKLPERDLKRGIINLKLARTLANLTTASTIIDPFCGQGRNIAACLDTKSSFIGSDVDQVVIPEAMANITYADEFFDENRQFIGALEYPENKLDKVTLLARTATKIGTDMGKFKPQDTAIVSEGTLGKNTGHQRPNEWVQKDFDSIVDIWAKTIERAEQMQLSELVFTLPFYPKNYTPEQNIELLTNAVDRIRGSYTLSDDFPILYSRQRSVVGHGVIKLTR